MDANARSPEIFAPFGEAFELTKKILFQPFDLKKWFVIGFAAWLATFFSGANLGYRRGFDRSDWDWQARYQASNYSFSHLEPWVIPALIVGVLIGLALLALILWLKARGGFMFTDCIVRNRGVIAEPWREFRREGNRYFVFQLVVTLCSMLLFGGLALLYFLGWHSGTPILPIALLLLVVVTLVLVGLVLSIILRFMVPVMYRQRCAALEAFRQVWALIAEHPGVFILFALFYLVLVIAGTMIGCAVACLTCCIAAIPYLGTVLLLPLVMLLFAFPLCFLRQFGDRYDVWAGVQPIELPPPPPAAPPVQESLPPA